MLFIGGSLHYFRGIPTKQYYCTVWRLLLITEQTSVQSTKASFHISTNHLRSSRSHKVCGCLRPLPFIYNLLRVCIFPYFISLVNLKNELGSNGTPSFLIIRYFPDILETYVGQLCARKYHSCFLHVAEVPVFACDVCFHYGCDAMRTVKVEPLPTLPVAAALLL